MRARAAGVDSTDMAERTGIDRATISKLETGKIPNPTIGTLRTYAGAATKTCLHASGGPRSLTILEYWPITHRHLVPQAITEPILFKL